MEDTSMSIIAGRYESNAGKLLLSKWLDIKGDTAPNFNFGHDDYAPVE